MGTSLEVLNSEFFVAATDKSAALVAMNDMWKDGRPAPEYAGRTSGIYGGFPRFAWLNGSTWEEGDPPETFERAMSEWRWEVILDLHGNVVGLRFEGESIGDELAMFEAIAPYVKAGSFIWFELDSKQQFRWRFDGEHVIEERAHYAEPTWTVTTAAFVPEGSEVRDGD